MAILSTKRRRAATRSATRVALVVGGIQSACVVAGNLFSVCLKHFVWFWDDTSELLSVFPEVGYFDQAAVSTGFTTDYLPGLRGSSKTERNWTFTDIVSSLLDAGLTVTHLGEHREEYCDLFPRMPPVEHARIPMMFSLMAVKST